MTEKNVKDIVITKENCRRVGGKVFVKVDGVEVILSEDLVKKMRIMVENEEYGLVETKEKDLEMKALKDE